MEKYADDYQSESDLELIDDDEDDVEDSGSELDNRDIDYKKKKRKKEVLNPRISFIREVYLNFYTFKMKKASKFIEQEAELSR
jgi:hypothetical protein